MTIFDRFSKCVLENADKSIVALYNSFIMEEKLTDEERKFISNNYVLMLKVGESARKAIPSVQNILLRR